MEQADIPNGEPELGEVTRLLERVSCGDEAADGDLFNMVSEDLARMARGFMNRQAGQHTLQSTALVNEAYLRLRPGMKRQWEGRKHFFRHASRVMRSILVDHARKGGASKREIEILPLQPETDSPVHEMPAVDVLDLDEALAELADIDSGKAEIVQLMAFGGLSLKEVAEVVGRPYETVRRHWRLARNWLRSRLDDDAGESA